jgi:hypothetical protein
MEQQHKMSEEMKAMEYEPLAPAEIALVKWSLIIGVGSLFILYYLSQWLFPAGH